MKDTFLVVDTETGGLDPEVACIVELAAVVVVMEHGQLSFPENIQEQFHVKIEPDLPVDDYAARLNGYSVETWHGVPGRDALHEFSRWVEIVATHYDRPVWTGCNPVFDLKFFQSDCKRLGVTPPDGLSYRVFDVQALAWPLRYRGEVENVKLETLRTWAGCGGTQKHTALEDVIDTIQVMDALFQRCFLR